MFKRVPCTNGYVLHLPIVITERQRTFPPDEWAKLKASALANVHGLVDVALDELRHCPPRKED